jgi:tripartite-type tricarboxylate transporter receptor subunit TctC
MRKPAKSAATFPVAGSAVRAFDFRRRIRIVIRRYLLSAVLALFAPHGLAVYPESPIRIVAPFTPGGVTDVLSRDLAAKLTKTWRVSVVAENRPGAAGIVGTQSVAASAPDGYTLLLGTNGTNATNVALYTKLPYDPLRDFAPISLVATSYLILLAHPSVPVASVRDLIVLAKTKRGVLNYGSGGSGSTPHLAAELFKSMAGVDMVHVPYKGGSPAMIDLLAGRIDLYFGNTAVALPHARNGRVRMLAVTSVQRQPALPELPTFAETGVPGYEVTSWFGLLAPARTPADVVAKLNGEVARIVSMPETRKYYETEGLTAVSNTPAEFGAFIKREIDKWTKVVKAAGIRVD